MAIVTTSTIYLQRLSSFTGTYPSATAGANGFDEVNATAGDTIRIPLRSGSNFTASGGQMNFGYTPNGNTTTGGTLSGFQQFSITNNPIYVTATNVTSSGYIYIWCAPSNGGSSLGFRATVKVNVTASIDLNISITTSPVLLNSSTTTYTNQLTGCGSTEIYFASYTAGSSQGSTTTYSNLGSIVGRTYNTFSSRTLAGPSGSTSTIAGPGNSSGDTVHIWAVTAPSISGTNISNSTTMTYTGSSYIVDQPDTNITLTPSTTSVSSSDTTTNPTVNVTGDTYGTQYRLYTNNIPRWIDTHNGGGTASATDFTILQSQGELPGNGQTFTYFSQARIDSSFGGSGTWVNTGNSFTITRSAASAYSVSANPTSINEGQSTTFTVTYSNISSARSVNYTIAGIQDFDITSGALTGSFSIGSGNGTATRAITLANDNLTDGSKTATLTLASQDSTGASTGGPSASVSIADTSTASSGSGTNLNPGTASDYGLEIYNPSGTLIINDISRLGTFLAFDSHTFTSAGSTTTTMFTGFDCSSKSTTGVFLTGWTGYEWLSPWVTRSSNGITLTINSLNSIGRYGTVAVHLIRY